METVIAYSNWIRPLLCGTYTKKREAK